MSVPLSSPAEPGDRNWRRIGLVGAGLALLVALIRSGSVTEQDLVWCPLLIVLAWAATAWLVFGAARRTLTSQPGLLVPIGVVVPLEVLREWLSQSPRLAPIMRPLASVTLWGAYAELSLPVLMSAALWSAYAAWQTELLIQSQAHAQTPSPSPGPAIRRSFWRALGVLAVGTTCLTLLSMPLIKLFEGGSFAGFAIFLAILTILYNLATIAMLPWVLMSPEPFWTAVKSGVRQSLAQFWRIALRVDALLILLGFVTYFSYRGDFNSSFAAYAHGIWIGGYEHHCHWYSDHQAWLKAAPVPLVSTVLAILFLTLAVALKLTVIRALIAKGATFPVEGVVGETSSPSSPSRAESWSPSSTVGDSPAATEAGSTDPT